MRGFLISDDLKDRIKTTVSRVEGMADGGNVTTIPTRFETLPQPASSKTFRVCTFTGSWSINASKTVTFRGVTTTPNTAVAVNLFLPISDTAASSECAIAKDGTAWYLVAVPLEEQTAVFAGSVQQSSRVTDVAISAVLNTSNCAITIGRTLTTAAISVIGSTYTSTFLRFKAGA